LEGIIEKKKLLLHWKLKTTFILKQFFLAKATLILKRREYKNGMSLIIIENICYHLF
jgi:hypothetical protein